MKKLLSSMLLTGILFGLTITPVFAKNYKYKVCDGNKSYTAELNTVGYGSPNSYIYGFISKSGYPLCVITSPVDTNVMKGFTGGKCVSFYAVSQAVQGIRTDFDSQMLEWRETKKATFNKEIKEIILERNEDNMHEYKGDWITDIQKKMK